MAKVIKRQLDFGGSAATTFLTAVRDHNGEEAAMQAAAGMITAAAGILCHVKGYQHAAGVLALADHVILMGDP